MLGLITLSKVSRRQIGSVAGDSHVSYYAEINATNEMPRLTKIETERTKEPSRDSKSKLIIFEKEVVD